MSALCLTVAGAALAMLALPDNGFTLSWTHSIEKVEWWERWTVQPEGLRPVEARVKGSGPGMGPPEGARKDGDAWTYRPQVPVQLAVTLANSSHTADYTLCTAEGCWQLADLAGGFDRPVTLAPCR